MWYLKQIVEKYYDNADNFRVKIIVSNNIEDKILLFKFNEELSNEIIQIKINEYLENTLNKPIPKAELIIKYFETELEKTKKEIINEYSEMTFNDAFIALDNPYLTAKNEIDDIVNKLKLNAQESINKWKK